MGKGTKDPGGVDQREADLAKREAVLANQLAQQEAAAAAHLDTTLKVLDAAQERDVEADARDRIAVARDHAADLRAFTSSGSNSGYGADLPARRHAAMDRHDAKGDRTSAADDRAALADVAVDPPGPTDETGPSSDT